MLRSSWTKLSAAFLKTDGGIFQTSVKDLPPHWVNFTRSQVPTSRGWRHAGSNHAWQWRKSSQEEETAPCPVCPYRSPGGPQTMGARAAREPQQTGRERCWSSPTWSACLYSRSTCPSARGGCSGWRPPRCRTSAWPPAWSIQGPCRADTWPSGRSWAVAGWSPVCRYPRQQCWRFVFLALWASPQRHPEWFHVPAFRRLKEKFICQRRRFWCKHTHIHTHTHNLGKWLEYQNRGKRNYK